MLSSPRVGASKRGREWEKVVAEKSASSDVYKSLFMSKEQREALNKQQSHDFCARGVPAMMARP